MKLPIQGGARSGRRLLVPAFVVLFGLARAPSRAQAGEEALESAPAPAVMPAARPASRLAPEAHAARVLRSSRIKDAPPTERLADELAAPGQAVIEPVLAMLESRSVPLSGLPDEKVQVLSVPQREIVLVALGRFGRKPVLAALEKRLAEGEAPGRPRAAIDVLGAVGTASEISRIVALVPAGEEGKLEATVTDALSRILRRDAGGQRVVATLYRGMPVATHDAVLAALGAVRDPRALELFARVMQEEPDLVANAIAMVRLVGRSAQPELNASVGNLLRERIVRSDDRHARAAVLALGELGDVDALPRMVDMLGEADQPGLPENALWALQRASGVRLAEPAAWKSWLEGELRWDREERPAQIEELRSKSDERVITAARGLLRHPMHRDQLAPEIAQLLDHAHPGLRAFACQALGELGSALAIDALLASREDPDAKVRDAAIGALATLKQGELPRDAPTW